MKYMMIMMMSFDDDEFMLINHWCGIIGVVMNSFCVVI
jgi:hypothetical protein